MSFNWVYQGQYLASAEELDQVGKQTSQPNNFTNPADAQDWLGMFWEDLSDLGVESVSLVSAGEIVFGPMGLDG